MDAWLLYIPWHFPLHNDELIEGSSAKAESEFKKRYPAVYAHLCKFKEKLKDRNQDETGIRYEWYALQRWGADYRNEFEKPKIIYPDITKTPSFAYDEKNMYLVNTLYMIPTTEKWLLGLLNSWAVLWFYKRTSSQIRGGFVRYIA